MRQYFLETERIAFSGWKPEDTDLARALWGDPQVTRYICAGGIFSEQDILDRLQLEIHNRELYGVQYWPVFEKKTGAFIGCCGLRPYGGEKIIREEAGEGGCRKTEETQKQDGAQERNRPEIVYELGFHLRPDFWRKGFAREAALAVMRYAFEEKGADWLFAGHHPDNAASAALLQKLGFRFIRKEYYAPTGLMHPSYEYFGNASSSR